MLELRWTRPSGTTTASDRLQWRETKESNQGVVIVTNWTDVPIIIINEE